jgi:hypothetical protein
VHVAGVRKQLVLPVLATDLPTHTANDVTGASLPANAVITDIITLESETTVDGDRSYNINLVEEDGTAIVTVATLTTTQINTPGSQTIADNTVGPTGPAYIEMATTGGLTDATAGEVVIVVEYIDQLTA